MTGYSDFDINLTHPHHHPPHPPHHPPITTHVPPTQRLRYQFDPPFLSSLRYRQRHHCATSRGLPHAARCFALSGVLLVLLCPIRGTQKTLGPRNRSRHSTTPTISTRRAVRRACRGRRWYNGVDINAPLLAALASTTAATVATAVPCPLRDAPVLIGAPPACAVPKLGLCRVQIGEPTHFRGTAAQRPRTQSRST